MDINTLKLVEEYIHQPCLINPSKRHETLRRILMNMIENSLNFRSLYEHNIYFDDKDKKYKFFKKD